MRDANCEGEILLSRGAAAETADISRGSESTMRLQASQVKYVVYLVA